VFHADWIHPDRAHATQNRSRHACLTPACAKKRRLRAICLDHPDLYTRKLIAPMLKYTKFFVWCTTCEPKLVPTTTCHVGLQLRVREGTRYDLAGARGKREGRDSASFGNRMSRWSTQCHPTTTWGCHRRRADAHTTKHARAAPAGWDR